MPGRRGRGWWHGQFRGCGYRITLPRQAILDVLSRTSKHLSAEEVYLAVRQIYPATGLTTAYRTLEILVQMGLVSRFDFGDGRARYELIKDARSKNRHHHLICTKCRRVVDYTDLIDQGAELLKKTEKAISKKYNFKISDYIIQFYGLCDRCRDAND